MSRVQINRDFKRLVDAAGGFAPEINERVIINDVFREHENSISPFSITSSSQCNSKTKSGENLTSATESIHHVFTRSSASLSIVPPVTHIPPKAPRAPIPNRRCGTSPSPEHNTAFVEQSCRSQDGPFLVRVVPL